VLDCIVLIFLVLLQLPKKEAGAGVAFGGSATDALFGAGSGNVLTKITKYAAIVFFSLAVVLSIMQSRHYHGTTSDFQRRLEQPGRPSASPVAPPATSPTAPSSKAPALTATNLLQSVPAAEATNAPASPAAPAASTNATPAK
jgi:preprotein translocase subunit SecG